jgi:hypothetical protein
MEKCGVLTCTGKKCKINISKSPCRFHVSQDFPQLETLPKEALQHLLLNVSRGEINALCRSGSVKILKICKEPNFQLLYDEKHPPMIFKNAKIRFSSKLMDSATKMEGIEKSIGFPGLGHVNILYKTSLYLGVEIRILFEVPKEKIKIILSYGSTREYPLSYEILVNKDKVSWKSKNGEVWVKNEGNLTDELREQLFIKLNSLERLSLLPSKKLSPTIPKSFLELVIYGAKKFNIHVLDFISLKQEDIKEQVESFLLTQEF